MPPLRSGIRCDRWGEGVFSTVGGRFRRIAGIISSTDEDTLGDLRRELQEAREKNDLDRAKSRLSEAGLLEPGSKWQDPALLLPFVTLLITIITLLLTQRAAGDAPTRERIDRLIAIEKEKVGHPASRLGPSEEEPSPGISSPGRNAPRPCGSAQKYKRCHGAPPTSPEHPDYPPSP